MKRFFLLLSAAFLPGANLPAPQPPVTSPLPPTPSPLPAIGIPEARLPGFAADLAQQPFMRRRIEWAVIPQEKAWRALATARGGDRQQVRWNYARSLIGQERGAEALGVLDVMQQDDPDLAMVDAYRLARGAALTQLNRYADAMAELSAPLLVENAEACLWRMRALAFGGFAEQAAAQIPCATPILRSGKRRPVFLLAAAQASIEDGKAADALRWLHSMPDRDPAANLYRGRAYLALGQMDQARLRFARVEQSGGMALRMDARLSMIEADVASGRINRPTALKRLAALRYSWRGDAIEERALKLSYRLATEQGDLAETLESGATLFRFFDISQQEADFLSGLQAHLGALLSEDSKLPLDKAAGLYWDYRDLSPAGAEGDLLVSRLAGKLQEAGLYSRAADLLEYQLFQRAGDLARGPLSVRVAGLRILMGRPDKALDVLKRSFDPNFPASMIDERKRTEAVALTQVGRVAEAIALLQDVPGTSALQAEILWKKKDWQALATRATGALPGAGVLDDVSQTIILRHAISLAMLGQEGDLAELRARYRARFRGLPSGPVFDMLTGPVAGADPATLSRAMAAIPSVSLAGDVAGLLDAEQAGT